MRLSGIFASLTTPFDHQGDIYRTKIGHNVGRWNAASLAGYVVGSLFGDGAGEGALLSHDERIAVWQLCAKQAAEGRILIADVSAEGVRESAEFARCAGSTGYAAVCAGVPARYAGLMHGSEARTLYFRTLADRSPVPVIVAEEEDAASVILLAQHPNIAGAILRGKGVLAVKDILSDARPGFQVLVGSAADLWNGLKDGAQGAVLSFAAASPYAAIAVWEAFRTREEEAGLDWQSRISHAGLLVSEVYGPAGLKHAMDLNGYYGGPPRLPLTPLPAEARGEIERAFEGFAGKT